MRQLLTLTAALALLAASCSTKNVMPTDIVDPVITNVAGVTAGASVSGTVSIAATATDDVAVTSFGLTIGGTAAATSANGSLAYDWDTTAAAEGAVDLVFTAADAAGNSTTQTVNVTVNNTPDAGTGHVTGTVLAPNGEDPVSGALVYAVDTAGASSVSAIGDPPDEDYLAFGYSTANGTFELLDVPIGEQDFKVVKGPFTREFTYTVLEGENPVDDALTTLPTGSGGGGTVEQMAVVTGAFDSIEDVLAKLGLGDVDAGGQLVLGTEHFTLIDGDHSLNDTDYDDFDEFISAPANLEPYRTIFLCCGNDYESDLEADPTPLANLKAWIEAGGHLYATDWSYDFIEQLFPAQVDYYGGVDGLSATAEAWDEAELGEDTGDVDATILDPALLAWLDVVGATNADDTVTIAGWLPGWAAIDALAASTTGWVQGPVTVLGAEQVRTLTLTFTAGSGTVFYSSYHTEELPSPDLAPQERILQYFLFEVL